MTDNTDMISDQFKRLISITKKGGTAKDYSVTSISTDESGGAKDFEGITNQAGGRLKNYKPQADIEVTIEGYAKGVGSTTTSSDGFYELMGSITGTSDPLSYTDDHSRDEYQLVLLKTTDFTATDATAAVDEDETAMRWIYKNGHFTNVVASDTDNTVKFTINFKCTPFNKSGTANRTVQSTNGNGLAVLAAYS